MPSRKAIFAHQKKSKVASSSAQWLYTFAMAGGEKSIGKALFPDNFFRKLSSHNLQTQAVLFGKKSRTMQPVTQCHDNAMQLVTQCLNNAMQPVTQCHDNAMQPVAKCHDNAMQPVTQCHDNAMQPVTQCHDNAMQPVTQCHDNAMQPVKQCHYNAMQPVTQCHDNTMQPVTQCHDNAMQPVTKCKGVGSSLQMLPVKSSTSGLGGPFVPGYCVKIIPLSLIQKCSLNTTLHCGFSAICAVHLQCHEDVYEYLSHS